MSLVTHPYKTPRFGWLAWSPKSLLADFNYIIWLKKQSVYSEAQYLRGLLKASVPFT